MHQPQIPLHLSAQVTFWKQFLKLFSAANAVLSKSTPECLVFGAFCRFWFSDVVGDGAFSADNSDLIARCSSQDDAEYQRRRQRVREIERRREREIEREAKRQREVERQQKEEAIRLQRERERLT